MIARLHMTDDMLSDFFRKAGYKTEMVEVSYWVPAYHNRSEETTRMELHAVIHGRHFPAAELFENILLLMAVQPETSGIQHTQEYINISVLT
jgi:hypothetical protein